MHLLKLLFRLSLCLFLSTVYAQITSEIEIKGMSFEAPRSDVDVETFQPLKQIGTNYVSLMPYAFANKNATDIYFNSPKQWKGEQEEGILQAIIAARSNGLKIMIKPHLWVRGEFTGNIIFEDETDWQRWEQSYTAYILFYAQLAAKYNVELFCIGTELKSFVKERPRYWNGLIEKVRAVYHGKLIYAANWDNYQYIPFWKQLDYIGIDAYFPLSDLKTPVINELKLGWLQWWNQIRGVAIKNNKDVLFTEIGYRSIDYCAKKPWMSYENFGYENQEAQANALQAFFETAMNQTFFKGAFLWKWHTESHLPSDGNKKYTFQAKKAMDIVLKHY